MKKLFLIVVMTGLIMSCSKQAPPGKPVIMVSILPQKYFVERIAGDKVDVKVMIPPGASPATYEPAPSDVINLHKTSAYFRIGHIGFELSKMEDIGGMNKKMKIYDCSEGVELIYGDHDHEEDDHGHSGVNPHIWLSPKAVKIIADNILKGLEETDPENIEFYRKNHQAFTSDLEKLDMEIGVMLKDVQNRKFIVYHPAWSYFAHDYGLEEIPVEINGKEPSAGAIKNLIDKARSEDIKVVFVQKQFDSKLAENIAAETGGRVIQLDPLEEKWFDNMIVIARNFQFELK